MAGNKFLQIPQPTSDITIIQSVSTVGRETLLLTPDIESNNQESQIVLLGVTNRFDTTSLGSVISYGADSIQSCAIDYKEINPNILLGSSIQSNDQLCQTVTLSKSNNFINIPTINSVSPISVQNASLEYGTCDSGSKESDPIFRSSPAGLITMQNIFDWNNISRGSVAGPSSSIQDDIVLFDGVTGTLIKDSGVKLSDLASVNHNHDRVYQPIGDYAPALGPDDNYITATEKSNLHSHSNKSALDAVAGINTGDQDLTYIEEALNNVVNDKFFTFTQGSVSPTWYINHPLYKFPSVSVVDSGGTLVEGEVKYIDLYNIILTFSSGFSGTAYLN